jgi:CRP/FNR family transcriptional regulator
MIDSISLPTKLSNEIESTADFLEVPANSKIISMGQQMTFIPFVKKGCVRVFVENNDIDKEQLLYYVNEGQTCLMSMIASFGDKKSKVSAITETDCEIIKVSNSKVREWQKVYTEWNDLVIDLFVMRYQELLETIDALSFKKIDERLYDYLYKLSNEAGMVDIKKTHLDISRDLSTSREVITRALKKLQLEGKIIRSSSTLFQIKHYVT